MPNPDLSIGLRILGWMDCDSPKLARFFKETSPNWFGIDAGGRLLLVEMSRKEN